jgi:hypothetical protein
VIFFERVQLLLREFRKDGNILNLDRLGHKLSNHGLV